MPTPYRSSTAAFMIIMLGAGFSAAFSLQGEPEIVFSKTKYGPFDEVNIMIKYPKVNSNPEKLDTLTANLFTTSMSKMQKPVQELLFTETSVNSDVFESSIRLTADIKIWPGDIVVQRDDDLFVQFKTSKDLIFTGRVDVDFYTSGIMLKETTYKVIDIARIIVIDPDENRHPDTIDTLQVRVWSATDRGGLLVTLRETGDRTGIFEELLTFTLDEESTGTRLRVSEGDTITAKYTDKTLPPPAALSESGVETVEVEELFAFANIGYLIPPLERAVASEPNIVDRAGESLMELSVSEQVLIQSEITNSQKKKQPFAYIVQIKDDEGATLSLSWVTGELPPEQSFTVAQSWIPDTRGKFSVEIFVWESIDNPAALSPARSTTIEVSQ
ncbi:MAG: hypothetical protein ACE5J2_06800 [Nitrososphaerales archaeon]